MKEVKKGILKNVHKFNNIKLAKGIDMTLYATQRRKVDWQSVGISTQSYGSKWIMTPKGRGLFKSYDSAYGAQIKNIRIVNELLCQELCHQVGIRCATYEPASFDGVEGLVTYDFVGKDNKLVPLYKFVQIVKGTDCSLLDCVNAIDEYQFQGYDINKKQAVIDLYKLIVFDTLTLQTDRNENNVNFLFSKTNQVKVADLIDNEFAFCGELIMQWLGNNESEEYTMSDIISQYVLQSKMFMLDGNGYVATSNRVSQNLEQITFYAKKHPALKRTLKYMLENIDTDKAFENIKAQGIEVNDDYQEYVYRIVECTKNLILQYSRKHVAKADLQDVENIY